ncbi:MAG: [Firmicutes bacterium]|nr:[FeFe] hydrogenase H-cluster radical SAM maturase HydE [Bacillota bacterium]
MKELIDKLCLQGMTDSDDVKKIIDEINDEDMEYLAKKAREISQKRFGKKIYLRGLIEISSFCKNDCYYCGIRRGNGKAERYRLSKEDILECCKEGYRLGFKTFVMQGGEDSFYNDDVMADIVSEIRKRFPECAITLSLGEKSYESYKRLFDAGADRYLLRHETANEEHYKKLHPAEMSLENRKRCLYDLKEIGYQVGCGIMVGSPYQTTDDLTEDLKFMLELQPHMIGIGPFVKHKDTPFADKESGSVRKTLILLSIIRILFPRVLLPATTALGTMDPKGREKGILAGANVLMPNLSPVKVRKKYALYDNKICTGEESAQCKGCLQKRIESIGYEIVSERGDY